MLDFCHRNNKALGILGDDMGHPQHLSLQHLSLAPQWVMWHNCSSKNVIRSNGPLKSPYRTFNLNLGGQASWVVLMKHHQALVWISLNVNDGERETQLQPSFTTKLWLLLLNNHSLLLHHFSIKKLTINHNSCIMLIRHSTQTKLWHWEMSQDTMKGNKETTGLSCFSS